VSARIIISAVAATATARLSYSVLRTRPPGGAANWDRTNHRGEPITLLEGPAVALGGVAGALVAGRSSRERLAVALAGAGAAAVGSYDDLAGNGGSKGFRGHLGALRQGELTTGAVKIAGIGATGLAAAVIAGRPAGSGRGGSAAAAGADIVINAGLIAGGANLLNLFDLRPGRAVKVALVAGGLLARSAGGAVSAAPLAAAAALLPEDLGERSMLGDGGANALGAMLGAAAATSLPRPARIAALGVVAGLTAASEVVSFSRIIDRTPQLRWLDMLGRRPADAGPSAAGQDSVGQDGAGQDGAAEADGTPAGAVHSAEAR
jgi:UDP-GlcNAc:undecaprenyl-phosphate/decaprenyl-phosphate GlcNAc-1-phosphate transferase